MVDDDEVESMGGMSVAADNDVPRVSWAQSTDHGSPLNDKHQRLPRVRVSESSESERASVVDVSGDSDSRDSAASTGGDGGGSEVEKEVEEASQFSKWPPLMHDGSMISKKLAQPRFMTSPRVTKEGIDVRPGDLDLSIAMNPRKPDVTEAVPNPRELTSDDRLRAVRYFMTHVFMLSTIMHERGELLKMAAGAEIGPETGHEHVNISAIFRTRRSYDNFKGYLHAIFATCVLPHADIYSWISVGKRGPKGPSRSRLYWLAYNGKQAAKGLIYENTSADKHDGNFRVGIDGDEWQHCIDAYEAHAGNPAATEANAKKQGDVFMPAHWGVGKNKPLPFTKANALEVSDGFCQRAGLMGLFAHSTFFRRAAWSLEGGRHKAVPSWALAYGNVKINEQQVDVLDKMAISPLINADSSYIRFAATGKWEKDASEVAGSGIAVSQNPLLWNPSFVLQEEFVEQLALHEAQRYLTLRVLPPRIIVQRNYPHVPRPNGYAMVIDLHSPDEHAPSYLVAKMFASQLNYNVTPHIYDIGRGAGIDTTGRRAAAYVQMASSEFAARPFADVRRAHVMSYLSSEVERFIRLAPSRDGAGTDEVVRSLLARFEGVQMDGFRGLTTVGGVQDLVDDATPEIGDRFGAALTYSAIVVVPAEDLAKATDAYENAQNLPMPGPQAADNAWRAPAVVQPIDSIFQNARFSVDPLDTNETDQPTTTDPDAPILSEDHHFLMVWRYVHAVTSRVLHRETMTPFDGLGHQRAQAAIAAAKRRATARADRHARIQHDFTYDQHDADVMHNMDDSDDDEDDDDDRDDRDDDNDEDDENETSGDV